MCIRDRLKLSQIDHIVFYEKPFLKFERLLETYVAFAPRGFKQFTKSMPSWLREKLFQKNMLFKFLQEHDKKFVEFLEVAWKEWTNAKNKGEIIPSCWPARRMSNRIPESIGGKVGYYAMASETSIDNGTLKAALSSKNVALTGAEILLKENINGVFSLCRPPGHHAAYDMYGGYCFLNNAAIAAQWFRDNEVDLVSILDVDFHHGNGTQDIFYEREDVLYLSIHGDPSKAFPYFSGYTEETGKGAGFGKTCNYPMPPGTKFKSWRKKLNICLAQIHDGVFISIPIFLLFLISLILLIILKNIF